MPGGRAHQWNGRERRAKDPGEEDRLGLAESRGHRRRDSKDPGADGGAHDDRNRLHPRQSIMSRSKNFSGKPKHIGSTSLKILILI